MYYIFRTTFTCILIFRKEIIDFYKSILYLVLNHNIICIIIYEISTLHIHISNDNRDGREDTLYIY